MPNRYFERLGTVWHKLPSGETVLVNNITRFANIIEPYRKYPNLHLEYRIRDNERPDIISYKLYDSVDYWWTILLLNEIYDFDNQWPMNEEQLEAYMRDKYPLNDLDDIHHYETPDGFETDIRALAFKHGINEADVVGVFGLSVVSIDEYERKQNELKRNIKLVDPDKIKKLVDDFNTALTTFNMI